MLFDPSNPDAFWLDVTNAALGVFCFVCIAAIGWGVWQDLSVRWRQRSVHVVRGLDPHTHYDPMLGPSMADGGDPVDRSTNGDEPEHSKQERDT